jgi:ABC-type transport system involved in cytochrome bd biosynthesis fused ATPase/permease subunit
VINKKLLSFDRGALRYVGLNVLFQWLGMLCNVVFVTAVARLIGAAFAGSLTSALLWQQLVLCLVTVPLRFGFTMLASGMSDKASKDVKRTLRSNIYAKLTRLGSNYTETVATSEVVMLASEGVEQIDTYFAKYLPQLFYSLLAPVTLFVLLVGVHARSAIILLCCVPLIPMSIVAVQKFAKKLLNKYWGEYTTLGDSFLENIQGLTTLKIYQADGWKHEQMNAQAERFRKITMKVLTMQLNSVTLMDLMAYGGAGLGIISAVSVFAKGQLSLTATLTIVLLAADFFLPLRLLGSYFHIAMNGAASAEKIFKLLAADEPADGDRVPGEDTALRLEQVTFGYEKDRTILHEVSLTIPQGSFVSLVGESGCGKSTIAALLSGSRTGYTGSVTLGGVPVGELQQEQRLHTLTVVPHNATIFKGTVEENLRMAKPDAAESELWAALEQVNLADFCRSQNGLQTALHEGGSNLSGGQRQRLAMARALLHDTPIYLFDEATSNVDAESENDIMAAIHSLAGKKTVILISHRLANVVDSDCIYVLDKGRIVEQGKHADLLAAQGAYSRLYTAQKQLETLGKEDA